MKANEFPYKYFDDFIKSFILEHSSIFSSSPSSPISTNPEKLLKSYEKQYWDLSEKDSKQVKFEEMLRSLQEVLKDFGNVEFLNHAIWLWAYPNNKKSEPIPFGGNNKGKKKENELFSSKGVAGAGSGYVQYKTRGVLYCLYLITKVWTDCKCYNCTNSTSIKHSLKTFLLEDEYNISNAQPNTYKTPESVRNLLLHLISPDDFEPIAAQKDKKQIVKAFEFVIDEKVPKNMNLPNVDGSLKLIRKALQDQGLLKPNETFYSGIVHDMWRGYSSTGLSLSQMLKIKKAVVLYGPPGTGKTYTARNLAKQLVIREYVEKLKEEKSDDARSNIKTILSSKETIDECISNLQFHINYSYEDFMVGQTIQGNNVVVKPGFIFDVIKKAKENEPRPHIVILDEINRTDISRVFGELFSAMEYRGIRYDLPYRVDPNTKPNGYEDFFDTKGHMFLTLPENIYFIGTMNEIDFSLERVDFALRRRFLWEYVGYKEEALEEMLCKHDYLQGVDFSGYVNSCTVLNEKIENNNTELGKKYEIGHAFFDISEELWTAANRKMANAKKILWEISIKPTLEAYCGSMDENSMEKVMKSCEDAFLKKSNDDV